MAGPSGLEKRTQVEAFASYAARARFDDLSVASRKRCLFISSTPSSAASQPSARAPFNRRHPLRQKLASATQVTICRQRGEITSSRRKDSTLSRMKAGEQVTIPAECPLQRSGNGRLNVVDGRSAARPLLDWNGPFPEWRLCAIESPKRTTGVAGLGPAVAPSAGMMSFKCFTGIRDQPPSSKLRRSAYSGRNTPAPQVQSGKNLNIRKCLFVIVAGLCRGLSSSAP